MRVILDVKESKALFLMELLNNFSFVKVQPFFEKRGILRQKTEKADVVAEETKTANRKDIFADVWGIWADRDIDIKQMRKERRERRTKYYDNATL